MASQLRTQHARILGLTTFSALLGAAGMCLAAAGLVGCASDPVGHTKTTTKETVETPEGTTTTTTKREKDTVLVPK